MEVSRREPRSGTSQGDARQGFPSAALSAIRGGLTKANKPTAANSLGLDISEDFYLPPYCWLLQVDTVESAVEEMSPTLTTFRSATLHVFLHCGDSGSCRLLDRRGGVDPKTVVIVYARISSLAIQCRLIFVFSHRVTTFFSAKHLRKTFRTRQAFEDIRYWFCQGGHCH